MYEADDELHTGDAVRLEALYERWFSPLQGSEDVPRDTVTYPPTHSAARRTPGASSKMESALSSGALMWRALATIHRSAACASAASG